MGEIISLLLLAGFGVYYYVETLAYRVSRFERTGGAGVYPRMILACLFVFIALRVGQVLLSRERREFVFFNLFRGRRGVFFAAFLLYVLTMPHLGYIVGTVLYLFFASGYLVFLKEGRLGGWRRLAAGAALFLAVVGGIYWFFVIFLGVAVPAGLLANLS